MNIEIIGFLAGLFTTIAIVPQIIKAYKTKKVAHLSPIFFSILLIGVFLWALYGFLKEDYPIIITNSISFLLNGYMLVLYFKYK
tara:strand:+ start:672 stop:923 length:252 start_codon:yes stop_codon:yes gene_type:complete